MLFAGALILPAGGAQNRVVTKVNGRNALLFTIGLHPIVYFSAQNIVRQFVCAGYPCRPFRGNRFARSIAFSLASLWRFGRLRLLLIKPMQQVVFIHARRPSAWASGPARPYTHADDAIVVQDQ
jgi:Zn-dependent protease with chaperone function